MADDDVIKAGRTALGIIMDQLVIADKEMEQGLKDGTVTKEQMDRYEQLKALLESVIDSQMRDADGST